jgi:hypothetical protein
MNPYITFFVALCIAGLVADILHFFGKIAIWLGYLIANKSAKVDCTSNILIGAVLSLIIALYFLFL